MEESGFSSWVIFALARSWSTVLGNATRGCTASRVALRGHHGPALTTWEWRRLLGSLWRVVGSSLGWRWQLVLSGRSSTGCGLAMRRRMAVWRASMGLSWWIWRSTVLWRCLAISGSRGSVRRQGSMVVGLGDWAIAWHRSLTRRLVVAVDLSCSLVISRRKPLVCCGTSLVEGCIAIAITITMRV